jgi:hypothetical protein
MQCKNEYRNEANEREAAREKKKDEERSRVSEEAMVRVISLASPVHSRSGGRK